ncbi:MAG: hypothetical protein V1876_02640, partial [Candidatus Peregrinibacteria bacterium]
PGSLPDSGPATCRTGWWRIPASGSAQSSEAYCGLCEPKLACEDGCGSQPPVKEADGSIKVCVDSASLPGSHLALFVHDLTHAQQLCTLPAGTNIFDTPERCCANEYEAHRVSCRIIAEDGILDELGVSIEECAAGLANASCSAFGARVCSAVDLPDLQNQIQRSWEQHAQEPDRTFPSCEDYIQPGAGNVDTRPLSMLEAMKSVCTPGCRTRYENTIGNNFCYVGQCIEQSIEEARLIPGRMATEVQDESFPWDACAAEDQHFGGLVILPAISPPFPAPYNPRLLVESLDRALCQINGLPALTPPVLCLFDEQRRLNTPTESPLTTTLSTGDQTAENEDPAASLQRMTQGIATRIGTDLLTGYLRWAGGALSDTVHTANRLIGNMEQVKLPSTTCPRVSVESPAFCSASSAASP